MMKYGHGMKKSGMSMDYGHHGRGKKKDLMPKATRVESAHEGETKLTGAPQHKDVHMAKATRNVGPRNEFPRRNDPKGRSQGSLGLKVGTRVTSKETRGMGYK